MNIDADGSFSLGLSTTVLPQAIALGTNHSGTIAGKLNGEITPTTPSDCWIEYTSTRVDAFSLKPPLSSCGMPHAYSTFSMARCTSPAASDSTLPCSAVISAASSLLLATNSSRNLNSTVDRAASDTSRQLCQARDAAATASSTTSADAKS